MRTVYYATLKGLVRQTPYGRITLNEMNNGKFYHRSKGWVRFELKESEKRRFYCGIAGVVWAKPTNVHIAYVERAKEMSILDRLWYNGRWYQYCAGQDYVSEIRYIQSELRKW